MEPSRKIDLKKINSVARKIGRPIQIVGAPVKVALYRPDNVELPPTPFVQNRGDEDSEDTQSSNTQSSNSQPPQPKLIKLTKKSGSQANIKLAVNNRALAISQAKTQKAGSVVEIVDKHGNVVGTKIVVGKKNQVKGTDGNVRKRGRPKTTGPRLQSVKSLRYNDASDYNEKLKKRGEGGKNFVDEKKISSISCNQPKQWKVTNRSSAVFKLTHRKIILEKLKQAVHSKQPWTKNFPVPMDVVPLELKQSWYKYCEFDDEIMDFNLFEQYIERIQGGFLEISYFVVKYGLLRSFLGQNRSILMCLAFF